MEAPVNTITMICWKRPAYLREAIASLERNNLSGISRILIGAEPFDNPEMTALLDALEKRTLWGTPVCVTRNPRLLGCDTNGFQTINRAFEAGSTFNIHVEEDVILSHDAIQFALDNKPNMILPECMAMCLHNHNTLPGALTHAVQSILEFNPYGWACTAEQWSFLKREWFTNRWFFEGGGRGWDWSVNWHCAKAKVKTTLMPMVSRATTIGRLNGTYMTPEYWDSQFKQQHIL